MSNKHISTLIEDVQELVTRKDGWFTDELSRSLSDDISRRLSNQLGNKEASERKPTLRLSKMGKTCPRALWASIHRPDEAEPLPPWAEVKFTFGHTLEALAVTLAKASGHLVVGEQDEVTVDGVRGHRDCVIDGCIVDIKSSSPRAFQKLKNRLLDQDDSFGYLDQLDGYLVGSAEDDLVTNKDVAYLLGIDKVLGHMVLYAHRKREASIRQRIAEYKAVVERDTPPECTCKTTTIFGNIGLAYPATYNAYKYFCKPNIRTFIYSTGPAYLTDVRRKPNVPEVDRHGKFVYSF